MQNFEKFVAALNDQILTMHHCSPDITPDSPVEFLDRQTRLCTGTIYLGRPSQTAAILSRAVIEPCCILLVCEVKKPNLEMIAAADNCTYIETSASLGRTFNLLQSQMKSWTNDDPSMLSLIDRGGVDLNIFWRYVLEHKYLSSDQARHLLSQSVPDITEDTFIRVLVADCRSAESPIDIMDKVGLVLMSRHPRMSLIPNAGLLIALFYEDTRAVYPDIDIDALENVLRENSINAAVSYSTRDFGKLRTLFLITKRILYIAPRLKLEPNKHLFHHDRYAVYYILDLCSQRYIQLHGHSDIIYLVHPAIIQLTRYDAVHDTGLRDLLYYYILNSGNLAKTAADAHMHRNTVINRMKKLQSLVPLNLEDGELCQRLLFSCQIVKYREQIMKLNVLRESPAPTDILGPSQ